MDLLKKYSLLVLIVIFSGGCSKEPAPQSATGDWLWENSFGGFASVTYKADLSERTLLRLDESGKLTMTKADTLFFSSDYVVTKTNHNSEYVLNISNGKLHGTPARNFLPILYGNASLTIQGRKLILVDIQVADGWRHTFTK